MTASRQKHPLLGMPPHERMAERPSDPFPYTTRMPEYSCRTNIRTHLDMTPGTPMVDSEMAGGSIRRHPGMHASAAVLLIMTRDWSPLLPSPYIL